MIEVKETLVPGAVKAVEKLQAAGLPVTILSGDTASKAQAVGRELGISDVHAGLGPQNKQNHLKDMIARGHRPFMVAMD